MAATELAPVHIRQSHVIPAPPDAVWGKLGPFTRLADWTLPGAQGEVFETTHMVTPEPVVTLYHQQLWQCSRCDI